MGKNLDKFLLLIWKNFLLQIRHPWQTLIEILGPVVFCALLVLVRSLVDPELFPNGKQFPPFEPSLNITLRLDITVPWSPCNDQLRDIMHTVSQNMQVSGNYCLDSSEKLEAYLKINTFNALAGVQFDDFLGEDGRLSENTKVAIRFPGELRIPENMTAGNWRTNRLFPLYPTYGPRSPDREQGAWPQYNKEGFLFLQQQISYAIVKHFNKSFEPPQVLMQRYPYPAWINDDLLPALKTFVGLILMCSFVITGTYTVKAITNEKEMQIKEAMKIMGLPNWLHWTAWFIKSFSILLLTTLLIVTLLKTNWYKNTDFSVLTLSNQYVIFCLLILYICATITLCFAISVFFSNANTAATLAGLIWFLLYFPYMFTNENYEKLGLTEKVFICLGSNSAIAYAFNLILMFEGAGEGLQWHNIWKTTSPDDSFVVGHIMIMLVVDTVIYLMIALYVEAIYPGKYGVPQKWYYPFTASYWCGVPRYTGVEDFNEAVNPNPDIYEKEPVNLQVGVKIKHLRKVYGNKKVAVRDLSLNMFEGHITVLLGHNGAGKTTTMSMLTGMFPPTSGTATVCGYDIRNNMDRVRESLGLCPQYNIIFNELTVTEHLYFFSRLKGLAKHEIEVEVKKYIELLELTDKKNAKAATLSGGMKRKLCVGIALCGNSKIVLLDEPTAGVDPAARRALWDLLQTQKKDRTILLSTHFMDEADLLGDRIAIMAGGQLQCCGSSFFLKKRYGAGYHLIMDKTQSCDVLLVTNLIGKHIPNIKVENNVGSELSYLLNESQSAVFEDMLRDLEENGEALGVRSFGISLTTMEEVFMKVGADHGQEESMDKLEQGDPIPSGDEDLSRASSEIKLNLESLRLLSGAALIKNQIIAMVLKRSLSTYRSWILFTIQIFVPVAFIVMAMLVARNMDTDKDLPDLDIDLGSYENPVTVINGSSKNPFYKPFKEMLRRENRIYTDLGEADLAMEILKKTESGISTFRRSYIIGATFHENGSITSWFNNEPYHSPPLALEYVINSIVANQLGENHSVQITNHPLPFTLDTKFKKLARGGSLGFQLAFNVGFSMAFVSAFYVIFHIKERVSNSKHLQFVSGVDVITFWGVSYVWDLLTFLLTFVCLIITLICYQENGYKTPEELGRIFSVFLCFGFSVLPLTYLGSFLFNVPATGYTYMSMFNMFAGIMTFMVVQVLSLDELELGYVAKPLHWLFLTLPHYSMCTGLRDLNVVYSTYTLCNTLIDTCSMSFNSSVICTVVACAHYKQCCDIKENYYSWEEPGIGRNLVFSVAIGLVLMAILLLIEYGVFEYIHYYIIEKLVKRQSSDESQDDNDVMAEKQKIRQIPPEQLPNYTLVLQDVTKYYKKILAVEKLCLGVNKFECFGLLGVNGAGKTTTFKMMTGDVRITSGDIWVNGLNLKKDMKAIYKETGYCPQFDALLEHLTGRETLIIYCLLRGISHRESKFIAVKLAKDFDFYRHIDKKVMEYSGGNKRKLSTAVSLIGEPQIIYLDEPTTGMDPATKRHIWNSINRIRDSGKCIILTSHSMEECEALCTRLAIMVNGSFKCLGSTQHLKNKFSEGYTLTIKIRKTDSGDGVDCDTEPIDRFVKENFSNAILREKYQELVTYYIATTSTLWSQMFGIMERGKKALNIEDYSLGQCSLEQVFLLFTKNQRQE